MSLTEEVIVVVARDADAAPQMLAELIAAGFRSISLAEWVEAATARVRLWGPCVAVVLSMPPSAIEGPIMSLLHAHRMAATLLVASPTLGHSTQVTSLSRITRKGLDVGWSADANLRELDPEGLAATLLHRRLEVQRLAGSPPVVIGFLDRPVDGGVAQIAAVCGFSAGLVSGSYAATFSDSPLRVPAIQVTAGISVLDQLPRP